jgi:mRNA interferase MazF
VRRGEIWTVAGGVYASKPRPALIIQDDRFDVTSSVTVCPLSTVLRDTPLARVPVEATDANGLAQPSEIMVDRITTVRRANLGRRVGHLTKQDMIRVEQSLLVFLGIAG